jgi:hypothetical protein
LQPSAFALLGGAGELDPAKAILKVKNAASVFFKNLSPTISMTVLC